MIRKVGLPAVISFIFFRVSAALAQNPDDSAPIIDGRFTEWTEVAPVYSDAQGDGTGAVDFGRLWMKNDDRFVYFSFEASGEVSLETESGIVIGLDTDHNTSTGQPFESIGAELVWRFGERIGTFSFGGSSTDVAFQDVGLVSAPTVTSSIFEFCLELDAQPKRLGPLFPSDTVSVVLTHGSSGDRIPDANDEALFVIDRNSEPRTFEINLARGDSLALRLLAWNVLQDGLFDSNKTSAFRNILKAVAPDVMVFEEVTSHTSTQTRDRITELMPPGAGEQWFAAAAPYSVVLVSKNPIVQTFNVEPGGRAQGFLIEKPPGFDRDVLVVGAHLKCCGTVSDDVKRQQEVDNIMASIRDAQNDGSIPALTPIIIAGDMNFVGDRQQPMTLIEGDIVTSWLQPSFDPDWDDTPLADVVPHTTGLPQTFTWISPRSPSDKQFSPGRLDYMVYTDAVLQRGNSFALYTPAIRFSDLQRLGLNATDSGASDHLPIVADFVPLAFTAAEPPDTPRNIGLEADVFPNPASETVTIRWDAGAGGAEVEIFDALGRRVAAKYSGSTTRGKRRLTFDVRGLPSGLYLVVARSATRIVRRGFVKRRATN